MRVALTKKWAWNLRRARELAELSQYVLAEKLEWKRSKIKRLELGEVQTIIKADYDMWMRVCKKKAGITRWVEFNIKKPKKSKWHAERPNGRPAVVKLRRGLMIRGGGARFFTKVSRNKDRDVQGSNLTYYHAVLAKSLKGPDDVLGKKVQVSRGVQGSVIGLEFSQDQLPLSVGDAVEFVLYTGS